MTHEQFFFQHYGLTQPDLQRYLAAALSAGGDYADLYFEYLSSTSLMVYESMVKSATEGISAGSGVRQWDSSKKKRGASILSRFRRSMRRSPRRLNL